MGYSKNPATVRKIAPELEALAHGRNVTWRTPEPDRWAYKIREALWIAKHNSKQFPELALAWDHYEISIEGNLVHAKRILSTSLQELADATGGITHEARLSLTGPRSIEEVIQFWLDAQPTQDSIFVTEVQGFTNEELSMLKRWAEQQTPTWELVHNKGQTFFTLRPSSNRKFTTAPSKITLAQPGRKPEEETLG